ncbi:hypothetical protein C1645_825059 [Glomus cerebriforme]|uniref:Uncharacterized protein n=1 Tax=Glomus cerebriforme TaxID=658196 RepID=A0A397T2L8_9GLOM|nr:hypothetical protein C1645_825059 [Glomus cerebriforme]
MARALVKKASKLSKTNNSSIKALNCIAYTNTVKAEISFEVTGHFDIIIAITNITTPVHVETLAQMLYRIHDSIKSYHKWDNNAISYKIDKFPAVIIFIEVEHQKCLSARYFIKKLFEALVIKETDFNTVATSQNLDLEEAKILKFDQKHSIADIMKHGYDEENTMEGLKAKDTIQWEMACYKVEENLKKSVIEDLHKSYLANY